MSDRFIREKERQEITGVPTSSWYDMMAAGNAPKPVPIGKKTVAWIESELDAWKALLISKRDAAAANDTPRAA